MKTFLFLSLSLALVVGQGPPGPSRIEFENMKKELLDMKTMLKQLEWVQKESYCVFKKGKCPAGFETVSMKTWIQRGASGYVDRPVTQANDPYTLQSWKGPVETIHLEKETLGNIGDSYMRQKCIEKRFNDGGEICFGDVIGYVNNEEGSIAKQPWENKPWRSINFISSNEFVLTACCK